MGKYLSQLDGQRVVQDEATYADTSTDPEITLSIEGLDRIDYLMNLEITDVDTVEAMEPVGIKVTGNTVGATLAGVSAGNTVSVRAKARGT